METPTKPHKLKAIIANNQSRRVLLHHALISLLKQHKKCILVAIKETYYTYNQILIKNVELSLGN